MLSEIAAQQASATTPLVPDWLRGLIRAVRREGMQPKDERVRRLYRQLDQKKLLSQSPWLQARLRYFWKNGLVNRSRPITTRRMRQELRRLGILPPIRARPLQSTALRPVQARPVTGPIRPLAQRVALRPVAPRRG